MEVFRKRTFWLVWAVSFALCIASAIDQVPLAKPGGIVRRTDKDGKTSTVQLLPGEDSTVPFDLTSSGGRVRYLTFDDLWFKDTNVSYTTDWDGHLQFTHFNVFNVSGAVDNGFINRRDADCAASQPDALHNFPNNFTTPSVIRSNATALAAAGLSEFFDVIAWTWKPLGPFKTEFPGITMDFWQLTEENAEYVDGLFSGWFADEDEHVPAATITPWEWGFEMERANWLEISAVTEEDTPMDFCLDNLVLLFHEQG